MEELLQMKEIIKSQWYQTIVDKTMWIACVVFMILAGWIFLLEIEAGQMHGDKMTGTLALGNENLMTGIIFFMFMVAWGMCRDCRNKTMFLDITSGHSRNKVFFGRLIPTAVIGIIGLIIIYCPCIIYFTAVNGWGSDVKAWHVLIRIFIFLLFLFRIAAESVLLSVLIRRTLVVYILTLFIGAAEFHAILMTVVRGQLFLLKKGIFIGGFAYNLIMAPGVEDAFNDAGEVVKRYEHILSVDVMLSSVISSIVIGGICIALAYHIFKKRDMH